MNYLKILNKNEKQEILSKLKKQFGISKLQGILLKRGAERIFLFQGSLNAKQIKELERTIPIERIGIYFAKEQNNQVRLSIDAIHLLKDQIEKNIFKLNETQMQKWMSGNEILLDQDNNKKHQEENRLLINNKSVSKANLIKGDGVGGGFKEKPRGFVIIKHKEDFLGTGKASENKITNFIPKSRRLKINQ